MRFVNKNGWKKENDLVLKIGFDSSGLYDIGQEKVRKRRLNFKAGIAVKGRIFVRGCTG